MKKKVLMCTEASFLPTGYGVYSKELLSRLSQYEDIEVAELSCYTNKLNTKFQQIPWRAYANKPLDNAPEMLEYASSINNEYGEFTFNTVCLDFQPDFVIDIRDPWVFEFQTRSPFRKFFNHIIMPTVDALPQNPEWIDMFAEAEGVFTYSEFGYSTLANQSSSINLLGVASPCASPDFYPMLDKKANREFFGISPDSYVIGTVMRNQRRKLYPDLFKVFKYVLETTNKDVYLYCHTGFPDVGWNIPELLMDYGLSSRVLFTYKCKECKHITASVFKDATTQCLKCGNFTNCIAGIGNSLTDQELNKVYNLFNIYVQYANSEGFGMPQLEAAQAGNIVISVNYSAMSSFIQNIDGYKIEPIELVKECETGCFRAVPNNGDLIKILKQLLSLEIKELNMEGFKTSFKVSEIYNWDNTAKKWADFIVNHPIKDRNSTWLSQPIAYDPAPIDLSIKEPLSRCNFLIDNVLIKPEFKGGQLWRRLLRDLTYECRLANAGDTYYFNESHVKDHLHSIDFTYQDAYNEMVKLREYYNIWERHRSERLNNA